MNNQSEGSEDAFDCNGEDNPRRNLAVGSSSTSLQDVETDNIPSNAEDELANVTEESHDKSELGDDPKFELNLHGEELDLESEMEVNEKPENGKMKDDDDGDEEELDYEEDVDDNENSRTRSRFTSERKALNLPSTIPRNIPDTLEISKEDEKKIEEFQQKGQRYRDRRNNKNDYLQQRRRQQLISQQCNQFSDQRGLLRQPMGLLRPPPLNLHLIHQRFPGVNNSDGLAQSLANVAVNLMMLEGNFQQQLRQRAQSQALQPLNAVRNQNPSKIAPLLPINRFQNSDNRLRAPCTLLAQTASSTTSTFTDGQSKIGTGTGLPIINSQLQARLVHPRPSHQPIFNQSGEISGIQVVNQGTGPAHHQMMMHPSSANVLPPPNMEGPRAQQHNQPIQVIGHPTHLQPGLFTSHGRLPLNLNIPPPQQQPPTNFIHQPIGVMVPISRPGVPFNAGSFVPVRGNLPQLHHQGHLQVIGGNFQPGSSLSQMRVGSSAASMDLIGQPIETVVLRQSGIKNKPATRPNNTPPNNVALQQRPAEKTMSQLELEEADKLARRAARFAKPVQVSPKASQPQKTDKVGSNQLLGNSQKRSSSPGSLEVENPAKLVRMSNRKVIARSDSQDMQHRSVLAAENLISFSGDGDYKDFELMKALEKQKRVREIVMKKKEESRQMQAQMRRKSTDSLPVTAPSTQAPIPATPIMAPNANQVGEVVKIVSEEDKANKASSSKPMKKVLMTKSQYKALLQHMKSKGIPLPTAVKEVSTKQAVLKNEFDAGTRVAKDRRIVQMPAAQETELLVPPELSSMPSLMVPGTMPIPSAVASHPRFLGLNSGASSSASTVIVSGLASTTKYSQLRSLAEKIGPIQVNIQDDDD